MIRKAYVDTVDGQLHYRYSNEGMGAPLVFFHMTASSSGAYQNLMDELEGRFPLIAFDTMNYGESYRTNKEPSVGYIADVMLEALTNMGIDRFHTFGHHTGVSTQVEMAVKSPDRVLSTIINGPTYATAEQLAHAASRLIFLNPASIKGTQLMIAWNRIKDNMQLPYGETFPYAAEVMHRDAVDMLRAGEHWAWAYCAVFKYDLRAAMKQVSCPKFFVSGARDISHRHHESAVKDYPDVPQHVNPDGGVYYPETHPADLAPPIINFIEGLNRI